MNKYDYSNILLLSVIKCHILNIHTRFGCSTVTETVLALDDIPWEVLKRRGHESVRLMELTRFYIELVKDPHGPDVALFIGNLPANLSQKQYENILVELLEESTYKGRLESALVLT